MNENFWKGEIFWTTNTHAMMAERIWMKKMWWWCREPACTGAEEVKECKRITKIFPPLNMKRKVFPHSSKVENSSWMRWENFHLLIYRELILFSFSGFLCSEIEKCFSLIFPLPHRLVNDFTMNEKVFAVLFFLFSISTLCHLSFACLCFSFSFVYRRLIYEWN